MNKRSCALVVVGNEILSGKIQDSNAYFTARELRAAGVGLERIAVVPDELDAIAAEVRECAARFDFVLTSGGVGPTHDDLTMEGVARAFGRSLVLNQELAALINEHSSGRPNRARLKMAEIPEGAILNHASDLWFPTIQLENVYILPGVPQLFEPKLKMLAARFRSDPFFMRTIYTSATESVIAAQLNECIARYPELMLGSYPKFDDADYRVRLTLESKDRDYLEHAFDFLIGLLPPGAVLRTE
ncbi:MAG TPA: molybdopterin-binding protein [Candidatus Binataceae bacterium]|jgi:molybdenum cofactor synthesis domain-containing protein|nr:molybdopterin-binding protein [Candidatus Binataceae bacterium]